MNDAPEHDGTWVYESIVDVLPGMRIGEAGAIALRVAVFEVAVLVFVRMYDLWVAVVAGTAAIVVTVTGSVVMLRMNEWTRIVRVPAPYRRLLLRSSIEVTLGVFAFVAFVTHLFALDPRQPGTSLMTTLFGPESPVMVTYLTLLALWDPCYRTSTPWWVAVIGLWGAIRYRSGGPTAKMVRRVSLLDVGLTVAQVLLLPFVIDQPALLLAVGGHAVAVTVVSVTAAALTRT